MKVGQLYEANQLDATSRVGTRPARDPIRPVDPAATQAAGVEADRVELSGAAAKAGDDAVIDSARVQAVQKAIAEGRYQIHVEKIADTMISQAAELVETLAKVARSAR
jgi:flagellar biosynthesis anti-sigma factor FlgM